MGGLPADLADKKLLGKDHRFFVMTREFPLPTVMIDTTSHSYDRQILVMPCSYYLQGNYVVQDLQLFSEGHPVPMGYEIVSHTKNDGGEIRMKIVSLCWSVCLSVCLFTC